MKLGKKQNWKGSSAGYFFLNLQMRRPINLFLIEENYNALNDIENFLLLIIIYKKNHFLEFSY